MHNNIVDLLKSSIKYFRKSKAHIHYEIEANFLLSRFLSEIYQYVPLLEYLRQIYESFKAPCITDEEQVFIILSIA